MYHILNTKGLGVYKTTNISLKEYPLEAKTAPKN